MYFQIVPVAEASVTTLMKSIDRVIINPIIFFLFAVAMVYFLYGLAQYFMSPANEELRKTSKSHMIWGIIGLFIMVGVFGIMNLIIGTLGVTNVQVSGNGNISVDGTAVTSNQVAANKNSNQSLFNGSVDISGSNTQYPPETYTTDPFPQYKASDLCWRPQPATLYRTANTEYDSLVLARAAARKAYLDQNGISDTDTKYQGYPLTFETQVLYDKAHTTYYAWIDARAPKDGVTDKNCNLTIIGPARTLPDPDLSIDLRMGDNPTITKVDQPKITSYTTDPFPQDYIEKPGVCWHQDLVATGSTEYNALQSIKQSARDLYLRANLLTENTANPKYPIVYGVLSAYDADHKTYYVWQDLRAPISKTPGSSDCNLLEQTSNYTRSTKPNPLIGNYVSDALYYRVVDSGVDTTYVGARSNAIHNALVELAKLKGTNDLGSLVYRVLPEEKYYPPDPANNYFKYDYWVVLEMKK